MSSTDYTTTNYDSNHTNEESYSQPQATERHRAVPAYWVHETSHHSSVRENVDDPCYCAICDRHFESMKRRERHVARSSRHPYCEVCNRRFLNGNALRTHLEFSWDHQFKLHLQPNFEHDGPLYYHDIVWETYDKRDFDDLDFVGDEIHECIAHLVHCEEEEQEEEQNESGPPAEEFTCPICEQTPKTICSTMCGHLFCGSCIKMAFDISGSCPVCDEEGNVKQLRKMYISASFQF